MLEKVDPATLWDALSPEQRKRLGVAAVIHGLGRLGADRGYGPEQGFEAASFAGSDALADIIADHLGEEDPRVPDLAFLGVVSCRECGCTDGCACPEGCSWVEEDLCSACAAASTAERALEAAASRGDETARVLLEASRGTSDQATMRAVWAMGVKSPNE